MSQVFQGLIAMQYRRYHLHDDDRDSFSRTLLEECMELLEKLPTLSLAGRAVAIERLARNSSPGIRERACAPGPPCSPTSS